MHASGRQHLKASMSASKDGRGRRRRRESAAPEPPTWEAASGAHLHITYTWCTASWSVHIFVYCTVHCTVHCTHDPYPGRSPKEGGARGVHLAAVHDLPLLPLARAPGRGARSVRHSGTGAVSRARGGPPCHRRSRWAQGKKGGGWLAKQSEAPKQGVRRVRVRRPLACAYFSVCVL